MTRKNAARPEIPMDIILKARKVMFDRSRKQFALDMPNPVPCDFKALEESHVFCYDPNDDNCHDPDLASYHISQWVNTLQEDVDKLQAVDLNNLACAYMWQNEADWVEANRFLALASEKDPENATINMNNIYANWLPHIPAYCVFPPDQARKLIKDKQAEVMSTKAIRAYFEAQE
jgi:hypothetical protein